MAGSSSLAIDRSVYLHRLTDQFCHSARLNRDQTRVHFTPAQDDIQLSQQVFILHVDLIQRTAYTAFITGSAAEVS
jgi:hypothetical protein